MKTSFVRTEDVKRTAYVVDADGKILGRMATRIAELLIGKGRVNFSPHVNQGDTVIVINAEKVRVTGRKAEQKMYKRYTGYPGGLREHSFNWMQQRHPEEIIMHAVRGMLPKNILGHRMLTRLRIFKGPKHPHEAQQPVPISF